MALLAAAVALALNVAASIELFEPQTTFGYQLAYTSGFEVVGIDPGTSAARAGIATGDHLDFRGSALHDRIVGLEYQPARPGETVRFVLLHRNRARPVTLVAQPLTPSESRHALFSPLASFLRLAGFGYIAVALVILLQRPSRMTWGLFLYLVSATNVTTYRFPEIALPVVEFASDLLTVAGIVGLLIFAARFPDDRAVGWRRWVDRWAVAAGALFAVPNLAWDAQSLFAGESPRAWMSYGSTLGALLLILIGFVTLIATYLSAPSTQRQRFQWVIAGVLFTFLSYATSWARYWTTAYPLATADAVVWTATVLYAVAPFTLAYAVVRQRVFEISFVISRTLVYTIVTATILGVFALVEWLAGRILEQAGAAAVLIALTAVAMAYSIHLIYARVEQLVERTLFRRRHRAEEHLADIAAGLPYAQNNEAVETALVREPMNAYELSSANLFLQNECGDYVNGSTPLDAAIALQLQGNRRSLRLHDADGVLAVPVFVRLRLEAVAIYGAHANGEDIDPDERSSLEAIGAAAGIAYDHLESARSEREALRWRKLAERQARELADLRAREASAGLVAPRDPRGKKKAQHPPEVRLQ